MSNNNARRHRRTMSIDISRIGISDAFDGGNIEFRGTAWEGNVTKVMLRIKPDPFTELEQTSHYMYFNFRSTVTLEDGADVQLVKYVIENAGQASYPEAWGGSTVFSTTTHNEPDSWTRRLDTVYAEEDGTLSWTHEHTVSGSTYFAHFPPYSYERHLGLISKCVGMPKCKVLSLGQSLDGRELECITMGTGDRVCWIIHRQHPGETMAEYYAEGLLNRLLGLQTNGSVDGTASRALQLFKFYIVPNMNPDGSVRGYLRTNACGANLNREWASSTLKSGERYEAPSMERSPEVYLVLAKMGQTGVDAFLDIHGDEELPFNFLSGAEGCPNWGPRLEGLQGAFLAAYCRANFDMNREIGYPPDETGKGSLQICSNQVAHRFDCLAVTLEMPYKDCLSHPDPIRGWTPARSGMLGASVLDALIHVYPYLRAEGEFWNEFTEADAYVCPTDKYEQSE